MLFSLRIIFCPTNLVFILSIFVNASQAEEDTSTANEIDDEEAIPVVTTKDPSDEGSRLISRQPMAPNKCTFCYLHSDVIHQTHFLENKMKMHLTKCLD